MLIASQLDTSLDSKAFLVSQGFRVSVKQGRYEYLAYPPDHITVNRPKYDGGPTEFIDSRTGATVFYQYMVNGRPVIFKNRH